MTGLRRLTISVVNLGLMLSPLPVSGQAPLFVQGSAGLGTSTEEAGPAGYAAVGAGAWKARFSGTTEIEIGFSDAEERWDAGLLRVWRRPWSKGFTNVSAGLAAAGGRDPDRVVDGDEADYTTVGIPLEATAALAGSHLGVGLTLFGNLNTEGPFGGLGLTVFMGRLPAP